MDAEVLPLLHELFLAYDNRAVANLCARVLAARDPVGFARDLVERIRNGEKLGDISGASAMIEAAIKEQGA